MTNNATKSRDDERLEAHNKTGRCAFEAIKEMVDGLHNATADDENEAARETIEQDPLWHNPGSEDSAPVEYKILLSTGGPATRIRGELSEHGEPTSARLEVQDWFVPWKEWRGEGWSEDVLLDYARCFYFGE